YSELTAFGLGRRQCGWRGHLSGRVGRLGHWKRDARWHLCTTRPDQDVAPLIDRQALALDEFVLQIFQICIIELELALEGAIGQAPPALQHGYGLIKDLLKGHRLPSPYADAACRRRCGNGTGRLGIYTAHD